MAKDPKRRLFDVKGREISTVDLPANEEPFFVVKAQGGPKEGSMSGRGAGNPEAGVKPPQGDVKEPVTKDAAPPAVPPELLESITKMAEGVSTLSKQVQDIAAKVESIEKQQTAPAQPAPEQKPAESTKPAGSETAPAAGEDPLARVATQLEGVNGAIAKMAEGIGALAAATGASKQPPSNTTEAQVKKNANFWDGFLPQ